MSHYIIPRLLEERVSVALVGAGGNGSQMLSGLARLDRAMRATGHPGGLNVTVFDPDRVSEANVGRQLFYPTDIGQYKASVLVQRVNVCFGLEWSAAPMKYSAAHSRSRLVIGCVDSAKARRSIHSEVMSVHTGAWYWLDLGNSQRDGQVILGQPAIHRGNIYVGGSSEWVEGGQKAAVKATMAKAEALRLRTVMEVFPELLDPKLKESNEPSCSLAEALDKQSLFVNQHVATWALSLLWDLFRHGKIDYHGAFINLQTGRVNPLPVPQPAATPSIAPAAAKKAAPRRRTTRN